MNKTNFKFTYQPTIELRSFYGQKSISVQEIMRLFQECTFLHIDTVEIPALADFQDIFWIVHKWDIEIYRYPKWQESLTVSTEIVNISKIAFVREYFVKIGDEVLVRGISHGVAIEPEERAIREIPAAIWSRESGRMDPNYRILTNKGGEMTNSLIYNLQYRDIDGNDHLNNVSYIDYLFEALEEGNPGLVRSMHVDELRIKYSSEIFYPGKLRIEYRLDEGEIPFILRNEKTNVICAQGSLILR